MTIKDYKRVLPNYLRVTYDTGFTGLYIKAKEKSLDDIKGLGPLIHDDWQDSWTEEEKQEYLFRTYGKNNCVLLIDEWAMGPAYLMIRESYGEPVEFYHQCLTQEVRATAKELGMVIPDDLPDYEGNILRLKERMHHRWKDNQQFSEVCARLADFMEVLHTPYEELPAVLQAVADQRHIELEQEWSPMQKKFKLLDALQY